MTSVSLGSVSAEYFWGAAVPLDGDALQRAADDLGVELACIRAVTEVEALGSGFYSQTKNGKKRPKILYESHKFGKYTDYVFNDAHPDLSTRSWRDNEYPRNADRRFDQVVRAAALSAPQTQAYALMSCSWGMFQILGMHARTLGYRDVFEFVDLMKQSEAHHLDAFVRFVRVNGLDTHLRALDFTSFARAYNGPGYKTNQYDTRMLAKYQQYSGTAPLPVLRIGANGAAVTELQKALVAAGYPVGIDGSFGPGTQNAVKDFQAANGLVADGVVGRATWAALENPSPRQAAPAVESVPEPSTELSPELLPEPAPAPDASASAAPDAPIDVPGDASGGASGEGSSPSALEFPEPVEMAGPTMQAGTTPDAPKRASAAEISQHYADEASAPGPIERMVQSGEEKPRDGGAVAGQTTEAQKKSNSSATGTAVGGAAATGLGGVAMAEQFVEAGTQLSMALERAQAFLTAHQDKILLIIGVFVLFWAVRTWLVNAKRDREAI